MPSKKHTAEEFARNLRRQRTMLVTIAVLAGVVVLLHATAAYSYRTSLSGRPLALRAAAAQRAQRLEPFNTGFAARADLLAKWNGGAVLLSAGEYNRAVAVLAEALRLAPPEPELAALYKRAQAIQTEETNRKAHLQHGHEGPGGILSPEDIER